MSLEMPLKMPPTMPDRTGKVKADAFRAAIGWRRFAFARFARFDKQIWRPALDVVSVEATRFRLSPSHRFGRVFLIEVVNHRTSAGVAPDVDHRAAHVQHPVHGDN